MAKPVRRRKIQNTSSIKQEVKNTVQPHSPLGGWISFDMAFVGLFRFVTVGNFTNKVKDEKDFKDKFSLFIKFMQDVKKKNFIRELINDKGMRHCHILDSDKTQEAQKYITESMKGLIPNAEDVWNQLFGGETLFQLGRTKGLRIIGTFDESKNVFHVLLFDWHHRLYPDERRNTINIGNMEYVLFEEEQK